MVHQIHLYSSIFFLVISIVSVFIILYKNNSKKEFIKELKKYNAELSVSYSRLSQNCSKQFLELQEQIALNKSLQKQLDKQKRNF